MPPSGVFAARGKAMPKVSIGKPDWWAGQKILGDAWKAPKGGCSYGLARFAFSLRPEGRQEVRRTELVVDFQPEDGGASPIAFDSTLSPGLRRKRRPERLLWASVRISSSPRWA